MGFDATKPVFGVSDKGRLKPVSSATETSQKIEILLVESLDMILSDKTHYILYGNCFSIFRNFPTPDFGVEYCSLPN